MKKKVLFVLHWPPPVHGSAVVGLNIKESKLINSSFACTFVNLGTSKSINEIGKNPLGKLFRYLTVITKIVKNIVTNRPELCCMAITASGTAFYKDALVVMILKLFRIRLVYHFHNKGVDYSRNSGFKNFLYSFVFNNIEAILLSKNLYYDVEHFIPESKIYICPNGISETKTLTKVIARKQEEFVSILFLSNLIESKGVFYLLDACFILKKKGINFKCNFIGGEGNITLNKFNEYVTKLGLLDNIIYLGKKYGEEKNKAFLESEIFVLPTYDDCFPLVLLEAMSYSLPIISTFEGGIPDIVDKGKNGFLVPQKDSQSLADVLEILIQNEQLRSKMGKEGREKYEQEFTLEKFEERFTEILSKILSK
jgi:glycosyltransferase involved in cell wall biosynthesis